MERTDGFLSLTLFSFLLLLVCLCVIGPGAGVVLYRGFFLSFLTFFFNLFFYSCNGISGWGVGFWILWYRSCAW